MSEAADIQRAWFERDRSERVRLSRIGCVLALLLIPAGVTLDLVVYPERFGDFLLLRLITDVALACVLLMHFSRSGPRLIHELTLSWLAIPQAMICLMIYMTEGFASSYYAGLNLAILGTGVLLPVTVWEVATLSIATLFLYLLAGFLAHTPATDPALIYNNLYFLITTAVISATAVYFNRRRRFSEFRLTYELDQRNKALAELDRVKSEFFANVSHELRTPLTLILSPVENLLQRRERLPEAVSGQLDIVRQNGLRLLRLVNDLLEVIRLEEGRIELDRRPLRLDTLLAGVLDAMSHLAVARNLRFERELEPEAVWISGDRAALEKVFFNLLSNAFKFTPAGGRVQVRSRLEGGDLVIEVEDTGIGIGAADLPHVFDRFRQVDNSATRRYSGTGLGLALVKEITEHHAGTVFIRSVPRQGTTIGVRLPHLPASELARLSAAEQQQPDPNEAARWLDLAAQQGAVQPAASPIPHADESAVPAEGRQGTVLIVDDEPDMRRYLVELLASEYHVLQASDGRQGLELARERRPELMVLDLMLPEIDGLEVCRRLKTAAETRGIRIVLLTARADETSKLTALDHGADDFLTKPFSGVEVQTRLRNLLRATTLERDLQQRNVELQTTLTDLRDTQNRLIHSEKLNALGRLSAGLLHEINNPLNYTLTALDLARNDPAVESDPELQDTLGDIDEGMQRIKGIVTELRAFAYPSKGDHQPLELADLIRSALQLTHHDIHDVPIHNDVVPGLQVLASRNHVAQVLVNLLTNAAKAVRAVRDRRAGEIRLRVEPGDARVRVIVRDTGTGIPEESQARVFDPFYTTRDVGEGMGMGLSVCQTIVRNHGGELSVRSEPGEWTEFTFDLALAEVQSDVVEREAHEHNA